MFKVNNEDTRTTPLSYRSQSIDLLSKSMNWFLYDRRRRSGVFIANFERISHLAPLISLIHFFYFGGGKEILKVLYLNGKTFKKSKSSNFRMEFYFLLNKVVKSYVYCEIGFS